MQTYDSQVGDAKFLGESTTCYFATEHGAPGEIGGCLGVGVAGDEEAGSQTDGKGKSLEGRARVAGVVSGSRGLSLPDTGASAPRRIRSLGWMSNGEWSLDQFD